MFIAIFIFLLSSQVSLLATSNMSDGQNLNEFLKSHKELYTLKYSYEKKDNLFAECNGNCDKAIIYKMTKLSLGVCILLGLIGTFTGYNLFFEGEMEAAGPIFALGIFSLYKGKSCFEYINHLNREKDYTIIKKKLLDIEDKLKSSNVSIPSYFCALNPNGIAKCIKEHISNDRTNEKN